MLKLSFHGAAETVTGSKYLLEADGVRVLIDCGLFQGLKELRLRNWARLPFDPASVGSVVLTHAHIDHLGYLPRLVKDGFRGAVYCTPATARLVPLMLYDSAKNQGEDAQYANRKGVSKHKPALPLYDEQDVDRTVKLVREVPRGKWFSPVEPFHFRFHDAGHLLGSAMIEAEVRQTAPPVRILFSGDVGRYDAPLYHDPAAPPACDYLICESTYGDREHPTERVLDQLCDVVLGSIARGGVMVVAAFAVGRAQQLMYLLRILMQEGRIPELPVFLDSPMASQATKVFRQFASEHDIVEGERVGLLAALDGRTMKLTSTVQESKSINSLEGPGVIISSSGMMTGGRILHHLIQRLPHERNTIVLGGYQPEGTRGRQLETGARWLRIYRRDIPVRAAVVRMSALSGHAGRSELLRWLAPLPPPKQVFITHGELSSANAFAQELRTSRGWNVTVPHLEQVVEL